MDSKEVLLVVLRSFYSWLTRYETVRATFTLVLLCVLYIETSRIIKLCVAVLICHLGRRLCTFVYNRFVAEPFECQGRGVVITGCDSGFGHDIAKHLDTLGFTVFAGCLYPQGYGARLLKAYCSKRVHVVELDVRSDDVVHAALKYVEKHAPASGIWAVVNNAGIQINGEIELMPMSQCRRVHDVNIYGIIRVTKAFLPLVRKSLGRCVTITSVFGLYYFPSIYAYTSSKHATETIMDSLRLEMKKFGVKVSLVEPGTFDHATSIVAKDNIKMCQTAIDESWEEASEEQQETYGRTHLQSSIPPSKDTYKASGTTSPVTKAVEKALTKPSPKPRYIVDGTYRMFFDEYALMPRLFNYIPTWISDALIIALTGCDELVRK